MSRGRWALVLGLALVMLFASAGISFADEESVVAVQKYDRAIHIMAMLLVGFGFLMVFVRRYGRSALTATFLLVSVAIPLYMVVDSAGILGDAIDVEVDRLVLAEFAAASLLICAGAALGRLKMWQYMILGLFFIPLYMLNEWIVLENGLGLMPVGSFVDTGGSIVIHAFGALFGLGVVLTMTTKRKFETEIESDSTSDRFSMLGSMVLWVFWPSFVAALVPPELVPFTAVNVIIALCGSTIATYLATVILRRGISIADIANAALAGGVAIGATAAHASHPVALLIGVLAGSLSTFGFAVMQSRLQGVLKMVDTCGVTNLHGWPGLMGGIAAVFVVSGISAGYQMAGIGITIAIALVAGLAVGRILSVLGRRAMPYEDSEEFIEAQASPVV